MKTFNEYVEAQGGWMGNVTNAVGGFAKNLFGGNQQPQQAQQPQQQPNPQQQQPQQPQQPNPAIKQAFQNSGWVKQYADELSQAIQGGDPSSIQMAHMKIGMLQKAADEVFNSLKQMSQGR
jgi:hypothetical protein